MKTISQTYKDNIKQIGREIDTYITYTLNGSTITLGAEKLNQVNRHYDSGILQSCMKQLDIETTEDIPLGTEINCQFGVAVREGKNLFNKDNVILGKRLTNIGELYTDGSYYTSEYIKIEPNTTYTKNSPVEDALHRLCFYSNTNEASFISYVQTNTFTTPNNAQYLRFSGNQSELNTTQLEQGSSTTTYEAFGKYEYINYGNYIIYSSEKQEDSNTYKIVAYDKMLYAMKDYESIGVEYPITIRDYIQKICDWLGFTFKNATDTFPNYDKIIENELYLDSDGETLNYTFRDVLTELAQATGSTICINDNDELELRYINDTGTTTEIEGTNLNFTTQGIRPQSEVKLEAQTLSQSGTPTPTSPQVIHTITGENTIKVVGKNMYEGSQDFSGTWVNDTYWETDTETYKGLVVKKKKSAWNGLSKELNVESGKTYTFSSYIKCDEARQVAFYSSGGTSGISIGFNIDATASWKRYSTTFTANASGTIRLRVESKTGSDTNYTYICGYQLEENNSATDYEIYKERDTKLNLGKNLFKTNLIENATRNGLTFNSDGNTIKVNGVVDSTHYPSLTIFADGSYTTSDWWPTASTINTSKGFFTQSKLNYVISLINSGSATTTFRLITGKETALDNDIIDANSTKTKTILTSSEKINFISIGFSPSQSYDLTINIQLERGSQVSSYSPYFEPIEYCKIGDYEDKLFKTTGKNLFDIGVDLTSWFQTSNNGLTINNMTINRTTATINGSILTINSYDTTGWTWISKWLNLKKNTDYIISGVNDNDIKIVGLSSNELYTVGTLITTKTNSNTTKTFNSGNYNFYCLSFYPGATNKHFENIMIEQNSTATSYEPYGKNEWWLKKAIGKVVLDGSESWQYISVAEGSLFRSNNSITNAIINNSYSPYCNYYKGIPLSQTRANNEIKINNSSSYSYLDLIDNRYTTASDFQTWLSTHNTIVYYQLAIPTYTKLTNTDLINQLEKLQKLKLHYGVNNILQSNTDLPIKLKFSYTNTLDTIDEEYFKDINVNFGEMSKPINTITFKRAGDSDCISLSYPEDLADEDKNEIAISDNQILAYDNRDEYLQDILDQLYGLSYAINDYSSTGITFYDLCDRYNASITKTDDEGNTLETNLYPCIMLNDEINISQGLQETIHTDRPEESTTDYNTTSKTDRLKTRTDLIVDKQNGEILAVTGVLDIQEDGTSKVIDGIRTTQTQDRLKIEAIVTKEGEGENEVYTGVRTGDEHKTFTFDTNGLTIESLNNAYKNIQDETGNYYYDSDTMIGKYTKDGSVQKNMALFGKYYYGVDENVNVETFNKDDAMFVSQLYEDGNGETGFGHFYNGD